MSIISTALSAAGSAIKAAVKFVARTAMAGVKSFPGAIRGIGRAGLGAVRLAGRVVSAIARVGYRVACVGTGVAANAANNILNLFSRRGQELPEPVHQELFSPTEAWVAEMEEAHLQHELSEAADLVAEEPNALAYQYIVSDDKVRRSMKLDGVSPEVRGWCHSLVQAERELVRRAGAQGMLRHIVGGKEIKGVRRVKARDSIIDFTQCAETNAFEMNDSFGPGREMQLAV